MSGVSFSELYQFRCLLHALLVCHHFTCLMQKFLDAEMECLVDKEKGMKNKYSLLTVWKNECGS